MGDRTRVLPTDSAERKTFPVASGVCNYFPDALAVIANVSYQGSKQHHPDEPLHWDRNKSNDHADTLMRHFLERGTRDKDGIRHSAKMAWRALAILQLELEAEEEHPVSPITTTPSKHSLRRNGVQDRRSCNIPGINGNLFNPPHSHRDFRIAGRRIGDIHYKTLGSKYETTNS